MVNVPNFIIKNQKNIYIIKYKNENKTKDRI
jgi:hypothetical protein